jgi:hypothetical protein
VAAHSNSDSKAICKHQALISTNAERAQCSVSVSVGAGGRGRGRRPPGRAGDGRPGRTASAFRFSLLASRFSLLGAIQCSTRASLLFSRRPKKSKPAAPKISSKHKHHAEQEQAAGSSVRPVLASGPPKFLSLRRGSGRAHSNSRHSLYTDAGTKHQAEQEQAGSSSVRPPG